MKSLFSILTCALVAASVSACDVKETESSQKQAHTTNTAEMSGTEPRVALVPWSAGGQAPVVDKSAEGRRIMNDPEQIAAGKQLFSAMNCVGCHFNGGGGIGPPLMDNVWIYGDSIENIAATIREGRPNGMPSFRGVLPEEQIWQVAAYVRSLSNPPAGQTAAQEMKQ